MIGTQKINDLIVSQLKQSNAKLNCGYGKFAKDLTKRISELLEQPGDDMKANKDWNTYHNFPQHLEPLVRRLEKGLHFGLMPRTESAVPVYEWIAEQENNGNKLETWITWANSPVRSKYLFLYKKVSNIQIDYPQAFISTGRKTEFI